jgi:hypothetical protein
VEAEFVNKSGVAVSIESARFSDARLHVTVHATSLIQAVVLHSLGALHGRRDGSTLFRLRDQDGHGYIEAAWHERTDRRADDGEHAYAEFRGVSPNGRGYELEIPFVCVDDLRGEIEVDLPVRAPLSAVLGRNAVRVLSSQVSHVPDGATPGPALVFDLDLGDWQDDWQVLKPYCAEVDGAPAPIVWQGRGTEPTPSPVIRVRSDRAGDAQRVTLRGATVQVRGPWILPLNVS